MEIYMRDKTAHPALPSANGSPAGMRSEIHLKWGKFSAVEIAGFKDKDDLVAQLQSKYSLDKQHAQREVDAFAKGRKL
jgi:hypothetical protein